MVKEPEHQATKSELEEVIAGAHNRMFMIDNMMRRGGYSPTQLNGFRAEMHRLREIVDKHGGEDISLNKIGENLIRNAQKINSAGWLNGRATRFSKNP